MECPASWNEVDGKLLRIRSRYVGTPSEIPEGLMCLGCVLGWPFAISDWQASDGRLVLSVPVVLGAAG